MPVTTEALSLGAAWPAGRIGEAVESLGKRSRLRSVMTAAPLGSTQPRDGADIPAHLEAVARAVGLEAEPVQVAYAEIERFLREAPPILLAVPGAGGKFLSVLGSGRRTLRLLTPELSERRVPVTAVSALLRAPLEAPVRSECTRAINECGASPSRAPAIRDALLRQLLVGASVSGCWVLRPGPELGAWKLLRHGGVPRRLGMFLLCHFAFVALWLGSWVLLGRIVLQDRIGVGMLLPWALLLATLIPLRLMRTVLSGLFAIDAGTILKQRLLSGAGNLEPARMREFGVGQLLGRALEAEAMETLTLASGLISITAVLELVLAAAVLGQGAGGAPHGLLLIAWIAGMVAVTARHHMRLRAWADARLDLTHEAVEDLVGHRTRLVQQPPDAWEERLDLLQTRYVAQCERVDRLSATLHAALPRAWLLVGLLPILPPFIAGQASSAALATALGGVLLAYRAFRELATGLDHASVAVVAWERLSAMVRPSNPELVGRAEFTMPSAQGTPAKSDRSHLLEGAGLSYRHASRDAPAVNTVSVSVSPGERVLLQGASGSGKSTLGSLLSGNSLPASGVLLLDGLDLRTVGADQWRRRVVLVPQFHDNRLFMGSLAFNLLMGREWPPSAQALAEAEDTCRALGLGDLLNRMPGGVSQAVGETGWRLSHGEQTRVFIARALLQRPEILILDESLAALDIGNLNRVVTYLRQQPNAMVVIAHP